MLRPRTPYSGPTLALAVRRCAGGIKAQDGAGAHHRVRSSDRMARCRFSIQLSLNGHRSHLFRRRLRVDVKARLAGWEQNLELVHPIGVRGTGTEVTTRYLSTSSDTTHQSGPGTGPEPQWPRLAPLPDGLDMAHTLDSPMSTQCSSTAQLREECRHGGQPEGDQFICRSSSISTSPKSSGEGSAWLSKTIVVRGVSHWR